MITLKRNIYKKEADITVVFGCPISVFFKNEVLIIKGMFKMNY